VGVRAYAVPQRAGKRRSRIKRKRLPPQTIWPDLVLLLDTETSVDPVQRLLFGSYRVCRWEHAVNGGAARLHVIEEGLFYGGDLPARDPKGFQVLQEYVRSEAAAVSTDEDSHNLQFYSLQEFLKEDRKASLKKFPPGSGRCARWPHSNVYRCPSGN
jgi:hypothetical protein